MYALHAEQLPTPVPSWDLLYGPRDQEFERPRRCFAYCGVQVLVELRDIGRKLQVAGQRHTVRPVPASGDSNLLRVDADRHAACGVPVPVGRIERAFLRGAFGHIELTEAQAPARADAARGMNVIR